MGRGFRRFHLRLVTFSPCGTVPHRGGLLAMASLPWSLRGTGRTGRSTPGSKGGAALPRSPDLRPKRSAGTNRQVCPALPLSSAVFIAGERGRFAARSKTVGTDLGIIHPLVSVVVPTAPGSAGAEPE
jgi:hypothetical protein